MMRFAPVTLMVVLVAFPLTVLPTAPVTWLAGGALLAGVAGAAVLSVALVTAGAALALVAYALALVIVQPAADPASAVTFGALLVVVLTLAQLAVRVDGAAVGASVIAGEIRRCLGVVGAGVVAAGVLAAAAAALAGALERMTLPVVVVVAAVGAVMAVGGIIALVMTPPSARR
jgi:hypothetical protein